jgi:signal transduction histidine kinase
MEEIELLRRKLERERKARKQAEAIAEQKTRDLFQVNRQLETFNRNLEQVVAERTAKLAEARDDAIKANYTKSAFLANMSHELRTPLNAIIGYAEMLLDEPEWQAEAEYAEDLHKILDSAKHLLALINDVLDISKIEAGKMELYLEQFYVDEMLQPIIAATAPLAKKNTNVLDFPPPPKGLGMYADMTKVRQCLLNLLSNACKFTSNGTVSLRVRQQQREGKPWAVFEVSDTGIGLSREQIANLFQPFVQADSSTTRRYGGTGLGLTISRRFCRMMGGDISVASQLHQGTVFTLHLPCEVINP